MSKMLRISATLLLITLLYGGYGHAAESTSKTWDAVISQAKKEGVVSLYALWPPSTRVALTEVFRNKFGIRLEFGPFSRGEEMAAKAAQEKKAGLNVVDVFGTGASSLLTVLKPAGLLGQIKPHLMISEVTDPKSWRGEKLPFLDKEQLAIGMMACLDRDIVYNTDLIKKGEITTYKELLKPQYKGKITMNDPTMSGGGNALMNNLAQNVWNLQEAENFLRQLITQQDVVFQRDIRLHVESVARGKFAIGLGADPNALASFINVKAPITAAFNKEGVYINPGMGGLAIPVNFAHPNAAKLFINWLLTKEGQTVLVQSFGIPSLRVDVATTGIDPVFLIQPGEKVFPANEKDLLEWGKMRTICKDIIDTTRK